MPFYAGKTAGLRFNNTVMFADSWSAEVKDDPIDLTTVNVYRNSNINNTLNVAFPAWDMSGTPATYVNGGIRETTIKIHGFHKDKNNLPLFGETVSVTLFDNANTLFKSESALVISATYNTTVKGSLEFDIELKATATSNNNDTDSGPRL